MIYSIEDFDFELPQDQIANEALPDRSASRMLAVDRTAVSFDDTFFSRLPEFLRAGDLLVLNNTRVFPARLFGRTETGASVEIFLIEEIAANKWTALARPAKRLSAGKLITFAETLSAVVSEKRADGTVEIKFEPAGDLMAELDRLGRTPLPPYIKRDPSVDDLDRDRYQTVYAKERGAIAAPTAGLHFTPEVLAELEAVGVDIAEITLHVGYGTFEPIRAEVLANHRVSPERFEVSALAAEKLNKARSEGRRVIAVGTTTTRTLEYVLGRWGSFDAVSGRANLTILPGYKFQAIDGLLTNFHLPRSSLLILVSTFGGHGLIMDAYRHAVAAGFRFYSYGDCMLIV